MRNCEIVHKHASRTMPLSAGRSADKLARWSKTAFFANLTIYLPWRTNGAEKIRSSLRHSEPHCIVRQRESTSRGGRRRKARALGRPHHRIGHCSTQDAAQGRAYHGRTT